MKSKFVCSRQLLFFMLPLVSLPACAQRGLSIANTSPWVTAGAYLQSLSSTSVVVRWETAVATTSQVRFGLESDQLNWSATNSSHLKQHVVHLSELTPATKYFYAIGGTKQVQQRGPANYFCTPTTTSPRKPLRLWVLGDPGTGNSSQRAVRDAYYAFPRAAETDLVLALGDNAYGEGTFAQYREAFFWVYRDLFKHAVVWPTLGNHDAKSSNSATESGPYYTLFSLPRLGQAGGVPSGTGAYYSFDCEQVHFICLNSEDVDLSPRGAMLSWLRHDLEANRQPWIIAFWHQCPYTKGSHDSDSLKPEDSHMTAMREKVLPVLEAADVDLVLCGHSHLYERSFLIHGHYGKSSDFRPEMILNRGDGRLEGSGPYRKPHRTEHSFGGTVYVNCGSAGHATRANDLHGLNHPIMCTSLNVIGSLVLDVSSGRLDATFLDGQGTSRDRFTILSSP